MPLEIALKHVGMMFGELALDEDQPRTWKLTLTDEQSGLEVSCLFDRAAVDALHGGTKVDGVDILVPKTPLMAVPKSRNGN